MLRRSLIALIVAEVVSSLGTLMSVVALPWFVLETTGSPGRMSAVLAAEAAPLALFALVSGRVATRLGARGTLLACDAIWAPATAAIPLLHYADALSFEVLLALAFVTGIPWAARYGAQSALVPELLGEEVPRIAKANAVFQTATRTTYFAGPAIGGALLAVAGAPAVLLIDAATFALSFLLVVTFVPASPVRPAGEDRATLRRGLALLRRDPVLRPVTAAQFLSQAAFMAMNAAVPVLAFTAYDRDATLAGVMLGVWGGGAMAGVVAERIPAAVRAGTMTVAWSLVLASGFVALVAAGPVLDGAGPEPVFAAVAAAQTAAAALVGRMALWTRAPAPQSAT